MQLLYFTDISQVQHVLDKEPHLFKTMLPITGDLVVASEFEKLNISFIDEWDFLDPLEIEQNSETAHNLAIGWSQEGRISSEYDDNDLFKCTEQDWVYSFEACLNAKTVYEKIFREYSIDCIFGYFLPSVGVIRTGPRPTHRAVRSVVQAVLFWLADKNNIPYYVWESGITLSQGLLITGNFTNRKFKMPDISEPKGQVERVALIINDGMPVKENLVLKESFKNLGQWQAISIWISDLQMVDELKRGKVESSASFLRSSLKLFRENTTTYIGRYPEIFANPHLTFQFERIWDEMELAANLGRKFLSLLDLLKPSIVIFGHEAFTVERFLVQLSQKSNIPTVGLLHSGLGYRVGYRGVIGDADKILVWNDIDIACLKFYGADESKLAKVGCIRYEEKFEKYVKKSEPSGKDFKNRAKAQIGLPSDKPVVLVLTAAINSGFSCPVANPRKHREALRDFQSFVTLRKDLTFLIKSHPGYDYYEVYRRMNDLQLPNLIFFEDLILDDALEAADICLMLNYFTTAGLEAMLHRIPVIYLNNAVYPILGWEENVSEFAINKIHSIGELDEKISQLITEKDFRNRTLIEADKIIHQILDVSETSARARLVDTIESSGNGSQALNLHNLVLAICNEADDDNKKGISVVLQKVALNHPIENILHAFCYTAGSCNVGISSISKILNSFEVDFNKDILLRKGYWWTLLKCYILGYNYNSGLKDQYSALHLMGIFLLNPKRFYFMSIVDKRLMAKYILKSTNLISFSLIPIINRFVSRFNSTV